MKESKSANVSLLSDLDPGPQAPDIVRMIVEIPKNSANKYEYDATFGVFRLDRVLYSPVHYPGDYGFIPGMRAEDGDPIDVLCFVEQPSFPGCMIQVRLIGTLEMEDEGGVDRKVVGVPWRDPRYDQVLNIDDFPLHVRREIEHFFGIYKELEGKTVRVWGWRGVEVAGRAAQKSRERYLSNR